VRVVVGLGNPGAKYTNTRHNVGFRVVAALAEGLGTELLAGRGDFVTGTGTFAGKDVRLVLPLTYMNASGRAVRQVVETMDAGLHDLLVVCDDVHLPLGHLRLRRSGSDGGHNGLASIIDSLDDDSFARLRVGVDASPESQDQAEYVLEPFEDHELETAERMIKDAASAVLQVIRDGMGAAMNQTNRKSSDDREDA